MKKEYIPDSDFVSREIFHPQMTRDELDAVYTNLFEFHDGLPESVVWRRHIVSDSQMHELGTTHEALKQSRNPAVVYVGFGSAKAQSIRSISAANSFGHGFEIRHEPSEGIHHAEVGYQLASGATYASLARSQRKELRLTLSKLFEPILRRP